MKTRARICLGAHLATPRGSYTHPGKYIGISKVIRYSGLEEGLRASPIEITSLDKFDNGT